MLHRVVWAAVVLATCAACLIGAVYAVMCDCGWLGVTCLVIMVLQGREAGVYDEETT
jgi:hypothetical protein